MPLAATRPVLDTQISATKATNLVLVNKLTRPKASCDDDDDDDDFLIL